MNISSDEVFLRLRVIGGAGTDIKAVPLTFAETTGDVEWANSTASV